MPSPRLITVKFTSVTEVTFVHPLIKSSPRLVTVAGISTDVIDVLFKKLISIDVVVEGNLRAPLAFSYFLITLFSDTLPKTLVAPDDPRLPILL